MSASPFAVDGVFWRKVAELGARHLPEWAVRRAPAVVGAAAAVLLPDARTTVRQNIRLIRGDDGRSSLDDAAAVVQTFAAYAGCLAEVLATGSKNAGTPDVVLVGRRNLDRAVELKKGIIVATIHTGGWELVGPLLAGYRNCELVMVMEGERDERAREIQDRARRASGLSVVHVGEDPLSSLPLLRHLREENTVALQVDRVLPGMRSIDVRLLSGPFKMPVGPLRLAQVSGAPLVPIFSARTGYRRYVVQAHAPIVIERRAQDADLERAGQKIADAISDFLREHPTQWFRFKE